MTRPKRIGHKGADQIAPGNTLASFDAALAHGVDMIEFDVLPERLDGSGRLLLAHDYRDARAATPATLEEGLAHFAQRPTPASSSTSTSSCPATRRASLDALREHGLADRTLISTMEPESLVTIREVAPDIRLGRSVPRVRRDYMKHPIYRWPAYGLIVYWRRRLPAAIAAQLRAGRDRRADGALGLRDAAAVRGCARSRRRALRLDGRRGDADRLARGARRDRDHHQRPAAVRPVSTAPDPQRLGGIGWARRTRGSLTGAERRRLIAEVTKAQASNMAGRVKLALGRLPAGAAALDLQDFAPPDSALAREAEEVCREQSPAVAGPRSPHLRLRRRARRTRQGAARPRAVLRRLAAARPRHRAARRGRGLHAAQRRPRDRVRTLGRPRRAPGGADRRRDHDPRLAGDHRRA